MRSIETYLKHQIGMPYPDRALLKRDARARGYRRFGVIKRYLLFLLIAAPLQWALMAGNWVVTRYTGVGVDQIAMMLLAGFTAMIVAYRFVERTRRADVFEILRERGHNVCPKCGYLRNGLEDATPCPECGTLVSDAGSGSEDLS